MKQLIVTVALAALLTCSGPALAGRCCDYPDSRIVWCDDWDNYCTGGQTWPGYPPIPDNRCPTDGSASPDESFFRQHWPMTYQGSGLDSMAPTKDKPGSIFNPPFSLVYQGGTNSAQRHEWDMSPQIAARHPGYDAANGTNASPLVLRYWTWSPIGAGGYSNSPMYFEVMFDGDRAPTDYVEFDCNFAHECNCYWANTDATCNVGSCQGVGVCTQGTCELGECVDSVCIVGPRIGRACSTDGDCNQCDGGANADCPNGTNLECGSVCIGGNNNGNTCTTNNDCAGTCVGGPYPGVSCAETNDCGACVGGAAEGAQCAVNYDCQWPCGDGQTTTCDGGTHDGQTCTAKADCYGGPVYPIVCQQELYYQAATLCPSLSTQVHSSICFGWLAQLDRNPCLLATGKKPTTYGAATFDGLEWWEMRQGLFPGNGSFAHLDGGAWFWLTIKSTQYDLMLESGTSGVSTATVPRQYTGPFNRVAIGTGAGCKLNPSTGQCVGDRAPWNYASEARDSSIGWQAVYIDTPVLIDGQYVSVSGACCWPDSSCSVTSSTACQSGDGSFQGVDTTCYEGLCCPTPFANTDGDTDVDQEDFAVFQLCFTGSAGGVPAGCACFNRDADDDVDADDYAAFQACWSGPNVPATDCEP